MAQNLMKNRRLELDKQLRKLCANVYYQPPESIRMTYPAIRYRLSTISKQPADNIPYLTDAAYEVVVIDKDSDSSVVFNVSQLSKCRFVRSYTAENLYHTIFIIYA